MCPNFNCIIIVMRFLGYITGFFMNFWRFWKKGGWNLKKIFSETTESISTKLCWNDSWVVLFQNFVLHFRTPTKMATTAEKLCPAFHTSDQDILPQPNLILHRTLWEIPIKIFLSENICSIRTKCWWNSHWMVLFQKYVRRFGPSIKMSPTAELSLT
jgi:hypothetical protein